MFSPDRLSLRTHAGWCFAILGSLAVSACEREPPPELPAARDSLAVVRDSLEIVRAQHTAFVREARRALAEAVPEDVELLTPAGVPPRTAEDTLLAEAHLAAGRTSDMQDEVQSARGWAGVLTRRVDSLRAAMEAEVAVRDSTIHAQAESITSLTSEVSDLRTANDHLREEAEHLQASVRTVQDEANRAYWVLGSREELVRRGIVRSYPGPRFLYFLWRRGEFLAPARSLDPGFFEAVDQREWTEIPLPDPGARYRLVSRQDLAATDVRVDEEGWFSGERIRITDPDRFWLGSSYLIILRES